MQLELKLRDEVLNGPVTVTTLPDECGSSAVTHWVELKRRRRRQAKRPKRPPTKPRRQVAGARVGVRGRCLAAGAAGCSLQWMAMAAMHCPPFAFQFVRRSALQARSSPCRTSCARLRYLGVICVVTCGQFACRPVAAESPAKIDFARDIQPLFEKHCYECHGPKKQEAGLRLDQRAAALAGGDMGHDIVPGKSGESLLWRRLPGTTEEVSRMPAKGEPLSADEIALVKDWIDQGAKWPEARRRNGKRSAPALGVPRRPCGRPFRR